MKLARRDLLKLAGGAALGTFFTPAPWKALDDVSIWTQNWSWMPVPPRGEATTRFTTCTLCPAGCPVRARCIGKQPVSLAGVGGGLCPAGLAGHHLPHYPGRVRGASHRGTRCTMDAAVAAVREVAKGGRVAILDQRPGRTASLVYRRWLAGQEGGLYLTPPAREDATLVALGGGLAFNLDEARTVVSFGAPLMEGWGSMARVLESRPKFHLVQIEARQSRTASMADTWLPAKPGTEAALALGLAHLLGSQDAGRFTPEYVERITGVPAAQVRQVARRMKDAGPAVVIGGGDPAGPFNREEEQAIAGLNLLAGAMGRTIVPRAEVPVPAGFDKLAAETALDDVPDGGIRLLIIDEAASGNPVPWSYLKRKLAPGAMVAAAACSLDGYASHADYVLPAPVYMETAQDVPAACDSPAATFSMAPGLLAPPEETIEPADFVLRVAGEGGTLAELLKARVEAIHKTRRGSVVTYADGTATPLAEMASADDLAKAFKAGARWTDAGTSSEAPGIAFAAVDAAAIERRAASAQFPLALVPFGWRGAAGPVSPIFSKLYQESRVRSSEGEARLNPATAREYGILDGGLMVVETSCGSQAMTACLDEGVMPGVIEAAIEPGTGVLEICDVEDWCGWRTAPARMRRA
ncbi:MAG TPA: molybdopterin dinucleotide binding domain-containing protein [Bryobacteraceae bacterium]|nr:molybdopterin dinucleotide binding domain-containing protein [Bryobacteraceae bacterium]